MRSRRRPARRGLQLPDRPHLDASVPGAGDLRRDADGLVEVLAVDEIEPADLLLGLGERPVRRQDLAVTYPDAAGVGGRPATLACLAPAALAPLVAAPQL